MHITKWAEYGILCCLHLGRKADQTTATGAAEISDTLKIPLQYTQQILHRLRKGGVIKSTRGPHGGFQLVKTPEETTLKEILYAAEGATFEVICDANPIYAEACVNPNDCALKTVWIDLRTSIDLILDSHTLASLMKKHYSPSESLVAAPTKAPPKIESSLSTSASPE